MLMLYDFQLVTTHEVEFSLWYNLNYNTIFSLYGNNEPGKHILGHCEAILIQQYELNGSFR